MHVAAFWAFCYALMLEQVLLMLCLAVALGHFFYGISALKNAGHDNLIITGFLTSDYITLYEGYFFFVGMFCLPIAVVQTVAIHGQILFKI